MSESMIDFPQGLPDPDAQPEFYEGVPTKRLLAWCADALLIFLISAVLVPFTAFTALFYFPGLAMVVAFLYRSVTLARGSATPGMRLMGIEFRNFRGERFDAGTAVLHTALYTVWVATMVLQLVSVALMLGSSRRQSLSDMILNSAAINRAG